VSVPAGTTIHSACPHETDRMGTHKSGLDPGSMALVDAAKQLRSTAADTEMFGPSFRFADLARYPTTERRMVFRPPALGLCLRALLAERPVALPLKKGGACPKRLLNLAHDWTQAASGLEGASPGSQANNLRLVED
jgi:hypothetical protein